MQYEKKIQEIFARHPSVQVSGFSGRSYKAGIDSMLAFDAVLGRPWKSYRCIHVAGTNGKGSVSSMLAASLAASGLRVGLYTSPHLLDFRERIKVVGESHCPGKPCRPRRGRGGTVNEVNGGVELQAPLGVQTSSTFSRAVAPPTLIDKESVMEFLDCYEKEIESLSFFEITTGMAFWWFERQKVDVAVIEVGLGGRLDSTNVLTPVLSVVTSIGLDHCAMLGDTRPQIALEKAGIFKSGVPALVWGHDPETDGVFRAYASEIGAPLHFADEIWEAHSASEIGTPLHFADEVGAEPHFADEVGARAGTVFNIENMDLRGEYQSLNVRTVMAALSLLGVAPCLEALRHTASITGLRGRWEILQRNPIVICDIGHNPPALAWNFRQLEKMVSSDGTSTDSCEERGSAEDASTPDSIPAEISANRLIIVYGIMADKALDDIAPLMPAGARYLLCAPDTPRALPAEILQTRLQALRPDLEILPSPGSAGVAEAVSEALRLAAPDTIIYIGGSTFVVAEALPLF